MQDGTNVTDDRQTDRQTDNATEKCVGISGIDCAVRAIPNKSIQRDRASLFRVIEAKHFQNQD